MNNTSYIDSEQVMDKMCLNYKIFNASDPFFIYLHSEHKKFNFSPRMRFAGVPFSWGMLCCFVQIYIVWHVTTDFP